MDAYTPGYRFPLVPQPKARPHRLVTQEAKAEVATTDRKEQAKVKARSGGRCEMIEMVSVESWPAEIAEGMAPTRKLRFRCIRRASENHHLIGGIGRRNKGRSIMAEHRLHCCDRCHQDITHKVLIPVDGTKKECAATVRYERVR